MDLLAAEHRLQAAQRDADVDALDALLHPRLVAVGPDGSVVTKADDLAAHRSGRLRILRLVEEQLELHDDGASGVTRTVALVEAVQDGTDRVGAAALHPAVGCATATRGRSWRRPSCPREQTRRERDGTVLALLSPGAAG